MEEDLFPDFKAERGGMKWGLRKSFQDYGQPTHTHPFTYVKDRWGNVSLTTDPSRTHNHSFVHDYEHPIHMMYDSSSEVASVPKTIYKQQKLDRSDILGDDFDINFNKIAMPQIDYTNTNDVVNWIKDDMRKLLVEEENKVLNEIHFGVDTSKMNDQIYDMRKRLSNEWSLSLAEPKSFIPTNKENNMSERQLRTPESPVETKDLEVALRALESSGASEILDAVALVQGLEANQRLLRANKLKAQDVGNHVQIIDGIGGVLTDLRGIDQDRSMSTINAVLDGKMIDVSRYEFVVVTAIAS